MARGYWAGHFASRARGVRADTVNACLVEVTANAIAAVRKSAEGISTWIDAALAIAASRRRFAAHFAA